VLAQLDRGERDDPLTRRLMRSCGVHNGPDLAMTLTRANSADAWGSHAPEVFAAAEEGSSAAQSVIQDAGRELALLVQRLVEQAGRPERVVAGGAVIRAQQSLWESLVRSMQLILPDVAISRLDRAPVLGAVSLATAQPEAAAQQRRVTG
jgi:N-acetylglucosamine kinase-like BadF-type ATPase